MAGLDSVMDVSFPGPKPALGMEREEWRIPLTLPSPARGEGLKGISPTKVEGLQTPLDGRGKGERVFLNPSTDRMIPVASASVPVGVPDEGVRSMGRCISKLIILISLVFLSATLSWGQTAQDAARLYKEGQELREKAGSRADMEKAVQKFEQALLIRRKLGEKMGEAACLNNIGLVYSSWGQYAKELEYYEKALKIARKIGDVNQQGVILHNIAGVYYHWGQYAKALEYYEKSLEIRRKVGDVRNEGVNLNNIAWVYYSWGQYAKALEYCEKSLEIRRKIGDVKGEGVTLANIGGVYHSWGQHAKTLEYYEKSLEIRRKIGDVKGESDVLVGIGSVFRQTAKPQEALAHYKKALEIRLRIGVPTDLTNSGIGHI